MKKVIFIVAISVFLSCTSSNQKISKQTLEAIKSGNTELLNKIIDKTNINDCFEIKGNSYNYLTISIKMKQLKSLKYFIDNGAKIESKCSNKPPLIYAVKYGQLKMVKYLIEKGANVNTKSSKGKTALDYAIKYKQHKIAKYLISISAKSSLNKLTNIEEPYIINENLYIIKNNTIEKQKLNRKEPIYIKVDNKDKDKFYVKLKNDITTEKAIYKMPEKLLVISDIEGNFNAFSSFLINNKVIDSEYNWIYKNGHLVLLGDFMDRGKNVSAVLWLIYKLEEQAKKQNGQVHFIIGNHEIMNFQKNDKYNSPKYVTISELIKKKLNIDNIYSETTEIGKWLHSKNGIEKIGDYIFVHAGIHPEILDYKMSIDQINKISRNNWDKKLYHHPKENKKANFLIGRKGIFWYRGLVTDYKYYNKIKENELDKVLDYYKASKIVIGHSVVNDISKDYNGKVIRIDVKHGNKKNSHNTKGLLIEKGIEYKTDAKGNKTKF